MKIFFFLFIVSFFTASINCADSSAKENTSTINKQTKKDEGFAVVELFTSEGCSSCPPADKVVANLLNEHKNIYVLSYHVDYWDNLGWKDKFSDAANTRIQKDYAKQFKLSSVYTPQVVVNGTEQFVGSDVNKLNAAVNNNLQQTSTIKLTLTAKAIDDKEVMVSYSTYATNSKLKVALIQLSADSKIQRGENSGATLHHVNIVRDVETASTANGKIIVNIPKGLAAKDCRIIAFAQDANGRINAAAEVGIQ